MPAIVVGGRIIQSPQNDLSGILGGVGDILNVIGTQKQAAKDREGTTLLNRTLAGDTLPANQAGPVRPEITDDSQRIRLIQQEGLKQRTPEGIARVDRLMQSELAQQKIKASKSSNRVNVGAEAERMAQTAGFQSFASAPPQVKTAINAQIVQSSGRKEPLQSALRKNADGTESEINATLTTVDNDPNLRLAPRFDPKAFSALQTPEGVALVDKENESLKIIPFPAEKGDSQTDTLEDVPADQRTITIDDIRFGSGIFNKSILAAGNIAGSLVPGEQATKQRQASIRINEGIQAIRKVFKVGSRLTEGEQTRLGPILDPLKAAFTDPASAPRNFLDVVRGVDNRIASINRGLKLRQTKGKKGELRDEREELRQVLDILPARNDLEFEVSPIESRDIEGMNEGDIRSAVKFLQDNPSTFVRNKGQIRQRLARRATELGLK